MNLVRKQILITPDLEALIWERAHREGISFCEAVRTRLADGYEGHEKSIYAKQLEDLEKIKKIREKYRARRLPMPIKKAIEFGRK